MAQQSFPWTKARHPAIVRRASRPATVLAPRMATAAVRIVDPAAMQLPLLISGGGPQIFVHEGARQALERRLGLACGGPVQLAVTDNRRRMVTQVRVRGTLRVRLHMMFLGAPERIKEALVRYVARGDRDASQLVGEYIEANSFRIRAERPVTAPLRVLGTVHDLGSIRRQLEEKYFGDSTSDVLVAWGRRTRPRGKARVAIKLGTYSATERLVRVHPAIDQRWVPRYFVTYIVYHELLHHVVPPVRSGRITIMHPSEFLRRERTYRHFERAIAWEKQHLERLLRAS